MRLLYYLFFIAIALLPFLVRGFYDFGIFKADQYLPFQYWGWWIWSSFGLIFSFVWIRGWFARLFLLSMFLSLAHNLNDVSTFFTLSFFSVYIFFLVQAALTDNQDKKFTVILLGAAIINSLWAISQYLGYWWPITQMPGADTIGGLFDNSNSLAAFLAISFPLFFTLSSLWPLLAALPLTALILSKTTMGILALVGATIFVVFKTYSLKTTLIAILVVMLGFIIFIYRVDRPSASHLFRWKVWMATVGMAMERPVLGQGFGSYLFKFDKRHPELRDGPDRRWASPHNEYLHVWFEQGLFGLTLVLGYIFILGRNVMRARGQAVFYGAALLALMINAIGFFPMRVPMIAAAAAVITANLEG